MSDIGLDIVFLFGLASFRLARLFVFDKIMNWFRASFLEEVKEVNVAGQEIFKKVPKGKGVRRFVGELLRCYWCVGIWISFMLVVSYLLLPEVTLVIVIIFAISALGSIIETVISYFLTKM